MHNQEIFLVLHLLACCVSICWIGLRTSEQFSDFSR